MEPLTASINYIDPQHDLTIVLRQATALDDMRRAILIGHEQGKMMVGKAAEDADSPDYIERVARWNMMIVWAGCRATLHKVTINDTEKPGRVRLDMPLEEFYAYPAALAQLWELDMVRLNPQWSPRIPDDAGGEMQPVEQKSTSNET